MHVCTLFVLSFISILLLATLIYISNIRHVDNFINQLKIPKKIWTYWDSAETMPEFVQMCVRSWKKYNPLYEITVVHKNTVGDYVGIPDYLQNHPNFNDTRSRFADLVRLYLLETHGGIWIDASCLMYQGFDEWLPFDANMFCYTYNQGDPTFKYPVIENWFIAAKPATPFINAWKREFLTIANYASVNDYVQARKKMGVDIHTFEQMSTYLAMHVAAQKLLQIDKMSLSGIILNETSQKGGPLWFLIKNGWNAKKSITDACFDKTLRKPFLKFHGPSREEFMKMLKINSINDECNWF